MAILLALGAAVGWGASDYFGGDAARRETSVFVVVAIAELLGLVLVLPLLVARGIPAALVGSRLLLAAVAGLAVTVELSLVYRAIGRGQAFITAPTGALGTAMAVTVGLISGDPFGLVLAIGLICALLGGGISAWPSRTSRARDGPGAWDTVATCLGAAAAVGVGGDLAYTGASHLGGLSVVSAIASLYPVTTIALARVLRRQRATHIQLIGIILALGGAAVLGAAAR